MEYEIAFTKPVTPTPGEEYINDCCIAGDVVMEQLLPMVERHYTKSDSGGEDWGWYIWFRQGDTRLSIDITTDDHDRGEFRIIIGASKPKWLGLSSENDPAAAEELMSRVLEELRRWGAEVSKVEVQ